MKPRGFVTTCANKQCGSEFRTSPRYPKDFCPKCEAQYSTVYVPRYDGMHSKNENPDADD